MNVINIIEGVGSVFDIFPTLDAPQLQQIKPVTSNSGDDAKHLAQDWKNIGNDIRKSMNEFRKSHNLK
ncbi:MAG TPA: hypothetical protein VKR58_11030 [Aquella sp.]|nr:hypothetical protein [Aquella sp.]